MNLTMKLIRGKCGCLCVPIQVQVECGIKDGRSALDYWNLPTSGPIWISLLATTGFILVSYIFSFVGFILRRHAPSVRLYTLHRELKSIFDPVS